MAKRIFIIHGWEGSPKSDWLPWLKEQLEAKGFEVHVPAMPNAETPKIEEWVPFLKEQVGEADEDTYFVGHSIGCQTIMRYLETLPENTKIGGIIFVAGFFNLIVETQEEKDIAKPWLETPINLGKIRLLTDKLIAIFSDNDRFVPLSDSKIFKEKLGAKIIIEHNKNHFEGDEGNTELPIVLNELLEMMK